MNDAVWLQMQEQLTVFYITSTAVAKNIDLFYGKNETRGHITTQVSEATSGSSWGSSLPRQLVVSSPWWFEQRN